MKTFFRWTRQKFIESNFYDSENKDAAQVHHQRLASRLFLLLITIVVIALLLYTALTVRKITITIYQPTQNQLVNLSKSYSTTLICPCQQISISYRSFTSVDVTHHSVCSSLFITSEWLQLISAANISYDAELLDLQIFLDAFWQTIAALCRNSKKTLDNAINNFNSTNIITPQMISIEELKTRAQASLDFEMKTVQAILHRTLLTIRQMISGNQIVSGLGTNADLQIFHSEDAFATKTLVYPRIRSYGNCSCLNMNGCRRPFNLSSFNHESNEIFIGLFFDCYLVDATLASSLQCYFSSNCSKSLHPTMEFTSLIESNLVRHRINTIVETLFNDLFIEDLNMTVVFNDYFTHCNPSACIYTKEHRFDVLFIFSTIIGVIGGFVTVLKFLSPLVIKLICRIRTKRVTPITSIPDTQQPSQSKLE